MRVRVRDRVTVRLQSGSGQIMVLPVIEPLPTARVRVTSMARVRVTVRAG